MSEKLMRHIVLLKFKDEATAEQIAEVGRAFTALSTQIPAIVQVDWASAVNQGAAYSNCLYVTFQSETDLNAYEQHPAHEAVSQQFGHLVAGATVVNCWL